MSPPPPPPPLSLLLSLSLVQHARLRMPRQGCMIGKLYLNLELGNEYIAEELWVIRAIRNEPHLYCNESSLGTKYTKFVPSSNAQSQRMQKFHGRQEDGIIVFHPFHRSHGPGPHSFHLYRIPVDYNSRLVGESERRMVISEVLDLFLS